MSENVCLAWLKSPVPSLGSRWCQWLRWTTFHTNTVTHREPIFLPPSPRCRVWQRRVRVWGMGLKYLWKIERKEVNRVRNCRGGWWGGMQGKHMLSRTLDSLRKALPPFMLRTSPPFPFFSLLNF